MTEAELATLVSTRTRTRTVQAWPVAVSAQSESTNEANEHGAPPPSFAPVDTAQLPDCGEKVGGHWMLRSLLGEGTFGRVFAAEDEFTGQQVALKVVGLRRYPREYAEHELRALAAIAHPNVVQLNEHGVEAAASEPYLWYTMPLYKGADLARQLKTEGCLSLARAHAVFTRIAGGVCELHSLGLRHQDIKPENIYLATMAGVTEHHPVLLDLGGAARHDAARPLVATFPFAAPEQSETLIGSLLGDALPPLTEKVDVYALAATLLFSLIGPKLPGYDIAQNESNDDSSPVALLKLRGQLHAVHAAREQDPLAGGLAHVTGAGRERLSRAFQRWLTPDPALRPTSTEFLEQLSVLLEWDTEISRKQATRHFRGTLLGVVGGLSLAACMGGLAGYQWHKRTMNQANKATSAALQKADRAANELHRTSTSLDKIVGDPSLGAAEKARRIADVVQSLEAETSALLASNLQLKADAKKAALQARVQLQQERLALDAALTKLQAERDAARNEKTVADISRWKAEAERDQAQQDKTVAESARARAERERDRAQQDRIAAEAARTKAEADREQAERSRAAAEAAQHRTEQDVAADVAAAFARGVTAGSTPRTAATAPSRPSEPPPPSEPSEPALPTPPVPVP